MFSTQQLGTHGMRHTFDILGMWIQKSGTKTAAVISTDPNVLTALTARIPSSAQLLSTGEELVIYPFTYHNAPAPTANIIIGSVINKFSYRRLLMQESGSMSYAEIKYALKKTGYQLDEIRGIYPLTYIFYWVLSLLAGSRFPAAHFMLEQKAFNYLSTRRTFKIFFSYIILFYAHRI